LDFYYNGKLYKDVEILTFVPYIKADNEIGLESMVQVNNVRNFAGSVRYLAVNRAGSR
jgi:hypothetical protein